MTTAADLLAATLADPDADLPRLLLADALEDAGEEAYAAFVRAQVAAAAADPWDPPAVRLRHRPDLHTGASFRHHLPPTGNHLADWHPDRPFRRGLGWAVKVDQLGDLLAVGDALFAAAPVGELHLPTAPSLDDWRALAARPWLSRVRSLQFTGVRLPIEAVRVLGDSPGGVRQVRFDRSSSPAAADLFGGLARSPLGRQLRAFHLSNGFARELDELLDELADAGLRVDTLSLRMMGLTAPTARKLARSGLLETVHDLDVSHNERLGDGGVQALLPANGPPTLRSLTLARTGAGEGAVRWVCWAGALAGLRRLDLRDNPLAPEALRPFARDTPPAGLRALGLAHCTVADLGVKWLTDSAVWPGLVELDLRFNPLVGDVGARHLLQADRPARLTALLLAGTGIGDGMRAKLRAKYGEAVEADD